jgi:hypothetical protein
MDNGSAVSRNDTDRRVAQFLFHLGKGLWSAVPVLGPLVNELVYEQFKEKLTKHVSQLSDSDVQRIAHAIPSIDFDKIDALAEASERMQAYAVRELAAVLSSITALQTDATERFDTIEAKLDNIPNIQTLADDVRLVLNDSADQRIALDRIERRRQFWIERISTNQRTLLGKLPDDFTEVADLWPLCQAQIPACTYKEFRFRLHELEWLDLVERMRREHTWFYRRSSDGRRANGDRP